MLIGALKDYSHFEALSYDAPCSVLLKTMHDDDANYAPRKVLIVFLLTLKNRCMNRECTGLILYYTPTISIENTFFIKW